MPQLSSSQVATATAGPLGGERARHHRPCRSSLGPCRLEVAGRGPPSPARSPAARRRRRRSTARSGPRRPRRWPGSARSSSTLSATSSQNVACHRRRRRRRSRARPARAPATQEHEQAGAHGWAVSQTTGATDRAPCRSAGHTVTPSCYPASSRCGTGLRPPQNVRSPPSASAPEEMHGARIDPVGHRARGPWLPRHRRGLRRRRPARLPPGRHARHGVQGVARPGAGGASSVPAAPGRTGRSPSTWRRPASASPAPASTWRSPSGVLVAIETAAARRRRRHAFIGELGLDGTIRRVPGVAPMVDALDDVDVVVPGRQCARGADRGTRHHPHGARPAARSSAALSGARPWPPSDPIAAADERCRRGPDLADVRGQPVARRALEIAAAGGHHMLFVGAPGSGKTMLAQRLPGLLPPLDREQALETTMVHSAAGLPCRRGGLIQMPPFRAPHHTTSVVGIAAADPTQLKPGEVSLATNGVLFMDELGEFARPALEGLREPLEEGVIRVARRPCGRSPAGPVPARRRHESVSVRRWSARGRASATTTPGPATCAACRDRWPTASTCASWCTGPPSTSCSAPSPASRRRRCASVSSAARDVGVAPRSASSTPHLGARRARRGRPAERPTPAASCATRSSASGSPAAATTAFAGSPARSPTSRRPGDRCSHSTTSSSRCRCGAVAPAPGGGDDRRWIA